MNQEHETMTTTDDERDRFAASFAGFSPSEFADRGAAWVLQKTTEAVAEAREREEEDGEVHGFTGEADPFVDLTVIRLADLEALQRGLLALAAVLRGQGL